MMRRLPPLNALRAFEATARHLSFAKAAGELNLTPSALSHQVKSLEDYIGQPLFERLNRAIRLTPAAERALPFLTSGFDRLAEGASQWRPDTPDTVLVIGAGPAFSAKWLAPRVYRFVDEHPEIELRIAASLKRTDFREDQVDAVIRFGGGGYEELFYEKLFDDAVLPLASPTLAESRGHALEQPSDLAHHTLLHDDSMAFMKSPIGWAEWLEAAGVTNVDATRGPRFSHADHGIDAAIDGGGVVLGRKALAERDLARGQLYAPFDLVLPTKASFWFACPSAAMEREKVKVFRDWLMKEIATSD